MSIISAIILVLLISSVIAITSAENLEIRECKKSILSYKKQLTNKISLDYKACKIDCKNIEKKEISKCITSCSEDKRYESDLLKFRVGNYQNNCKYSILNPDAKCLGDKYNAGDIFLDACKICRCDFNEKITCKDTEYCNYNDININEEQCTNNGGLYLQLCNGPYFDIVCSKKKYCLCSGSNNYTCPKDYDCIHDFMVSLNRRDNTISGWKSLLGEALGNIGICAKKPVLINCGNGVCDNILSEDSIAETKYNCPSDCS